MWLSDLDKVLQSSLIQITFYISASILLVLIGFIISYVRTMINERAKINTITANFNTLKEQLIENTKATKSIEANIIQKQWVNQQAWLKKNQCYEEIFTALLDYVSYVNYLQSRAEYEKFITEGPDVYIDQYSQPEEIEEWKRLKEEIEREKASGETKDQEHALYLKHSLAEKKLADSLFIYSVFLDPQVNENISHAMASVSVKTDWETDEENYSRMHEDVKKAIDNIRLICRKELQL
ncbi:hypothetical protein [Serratia fonticola]|uniref:hypothetical protein n=1 Tax=Serratia fonticola TaxID=47917 RepID=UPI003AB0C2BD